MTIAASSLLCLAAFVALALSLSRHHRDVFVTALPPGREHALRLVGWVLVALSLVPPIADLGPGIGLASWFAGATLSGLCTALLMTYRPRLTMPAALVSLPLAAAALCLSRSA